jgi:hypothetical protein
VNTAARYLLIFILAVSSAPALEVVPSPYVSVESVSFIGEGRISFGDPKFTVDRVLKGSGAAGDVYVLVDPAQDIFSTFQRLAQTITGERVIVLGDREGSELVLKHGGSGIWPQGLHPTTFPADTVDDAREFILSLLSYQALAGEPQTLIDRLIKDATTERRYAAVEFADQALPQLPQFQDADIANDLVTAVMTSAWEASPRDPYLDEKFLQLAPRISPSIALPEMARIAGQSGSRADQARNLLEQNLRIRDMIEGEGWTLPSLNRAVEENLDFLRGIDGDRALKLLDNPLPALRAAGEQVLERVIQTEEQTQGPPEPKADLETWRRRLEPLRRLELETMTIEKAQ